MHALLETRIQAIVIRLDGLFCNFRSNYPPYWNTVADTKHPGFEGGLSCVKASEVRLKCEAEVRRKEKPQDLATKKIQEGLVESSEPEPETEAKDFKVDYKAAVSEA